MDSRNILGGRNVVGDLVCPWPWRCYDAVHYDAAHARLGQAGLGWVLVVILAGVIHW